jgi:branched-chain amino acid transport system ATP-binding protein
MLEIKNVETYYGNIRALKGVSLCVSDGEIITLIGANGAGKSTTLMTVCGIVSARSGDITFQGKSIRSLEPNVIVSLGISQVPEGRRIFPMMTVAENLDMGAFLRKDKAGIERDMEYVFTLFPILKNRIHQQGGTLSGGEQQMLAISRALMSKPRLLLLDEPSLGLAPLVVQQIFKMIQKVNSENGTTILLVEQNAFMALKIANRCYVMENGAITMEGAAEDLLKDEGIKKAYLGL